MELDGLFLTERTPTSLTRLPVGEHDIVLKAPGYKPYTKRVEISEANRRAIVDAVLERAPAAKVRLRIGTEPAGAIVIVDGIERGPTPVEIEAPPNGRLVVEAYAQGFVAKKQSVELGGAEEQQVLIPLARADAEPPPKAPEAASGAQTQTAPQPEPASPPEPPPVRPEPKPPVAHPQTAKPPEPPPSPGPPKPPDHRAPTGPGTVVVQSEPPAKLWNGRDELGATPFNGKLSAGKHVLTLVNRDEGLEFAFPVVVKSDETVTRQFHFRPGEVLFVVKPWADIYLRGKKLGTTPMGKITLLEGQQTFTLVNTELGKKKTVEITIRPGQLEKRSVDMTAD